MEWVGGAGLLMMLAVACLCAYWERGEGVKRHGFKEAQAQLEAEQLSKWAEAKRSLRRASHNEWLLMWYNALPESRRSYLENVWAQSVMKTPWMMNATGSVERYEREKLEFLLKCAANMVDAVLDPPKEVAKLATAEVDGSLRVDHVRADHIRITAGLDGSAAVVGEMSAAEIERWKDVRRQWAQKHNWPEPERSRVGAKTPRQACSTCACGPNDAC